MTLSDRDLAFLAFEGEWRRHAGAKEEAIRAEFGLTPARYYQVLGRLIDTPDALLVTTTENAQRVKGVVDALKLTGRGDVL